MIHLDVRLHTHPKIQRAGELLGKHGVARAYTMFAAGIAYAREYLTDGKVPETFVANFASDHQAKAVAEVLADPRVKLWHRTKTGYRIHDYLDFNRKASDVKQFREKEKERVKAWRDHQKNGRRGRK